MIKCQKILLPIIILMILSLRTSYAAANENLQNGTASLYEAVASAIQIMKQSDPTHGFTQHELSVRYLHANAGDNQCAEKTWMIVNIPPKCETGKCDYLIYSKNNINTNRAAYRYLGKVEMNNYHLLCFKNNKNTNYYMISTLQSAQGKLQYSLHKISTTKLEKQGSVDLDKNNAVTLQNKIDNKNMTEAEIIHLFNQTMVKN